MKFGQTLQQAVLLRRYKRFLADVEMADGRRITVHCPNSGSMLGCSQEGSIVMISQSANPGRKYPHTLEMVMVGATWVGINTSRTNQIVCEALEQGIVKEIGTVDTIFKEVKTSARSRLDFMVTRGATRTYIEVKNCTLVDRGKAMFPDAVTKRGTKHLNELYSLKQKGFEAVILFCIQRLDAQTFTPAGHIDREYADRLAFVQQRGVKVLAYQAAVSPNEIQIIRGVPVLL